jgi:hypothetical protein
MVARGGECVLRACERAAVHVIQAQHRTAGAPGDILPIEPLCAAVLPLGKRLQDARQIVLVTRADAQYLADGMLRKGSEDRTVPTAAWPWGQSNATASPVGRPWPKRATVARHCLWRCVPAGGCRGRVRWGRVCGRKVPAAPGPPPCGRRLRRCSRASAVALRGRCAVWRPSTRPSDAGGVGRECAVSGVSVALGAQDAGRCPLPTASAMRGAERGCALCYLGDAGRRCPSPPLARPGLATRAIGSGLWVILQEKKDLTTGFVHDRVSVACGPPLTAGVRCQKFAVVYSCRIH